MMDFKDRFFTGVQSAYQATFHKKRLLGRMSYYREELYSIGNDINYFGSSKEYIWYCNTKNEQCKRGIKLYAEKKYKEAFEIFQTIDAAIYPEVNYCLALCHFFGRGTKKDIKKAFEIAKDAADRSLCCSQFIARCYIEGKGTSCNKEKAYELIAKMSENPSGNINDINDDYSFPELFYFCGEYKLEKNEKESAERYFRKATDGDFGMAYYALGKLFYNDEPEKAKQYFEKAKVLRVYVEAKYYEDREELPDESMSEYVSVATNLVDQAGELGEGLGRLEKLKTKFEAGKLDHETTIRIAEANKNRAELKAKRSEKRLVRLNKKNKGS